MARTRDDLGVSAARKVELDYDICHMKLACPYIYESSKRRTNSITFEYSKGISQGIFISKSIILHSLRPPDDAWAAVVVNVVGDIICAGSSQKVGDNAL